MWDVHKDCRRVLVIAATVLTAGVVLAPAAQAGALPQVTTVRVSAPPATAKASACITLDGTARNALTYGINPTRYKYSGSPYLGLRYNSCAGTMRVYFGGFNATHYNIKPVYPNTTQFEVLGGLRRSITRNETDWGLKGFTVQACNRGGLFSSSSCTRWSPTVTILIPKEAAGQPYPISYPTRAQD